MSDDLRQAADIRQSKLESLQKLLKLMPVIMSVEYYDMSLVADLLEKNGGTNQPY